MSQLPPDIRPDPILEFSPTLVNMLASCPYRVALRAAGLVKERPSPFTAIGNVAHKLNERVWQGDFDAMGTTPTQGRPCPTHGLSSRRPNGTGSGLPGIRRSPRQPRSGRGWR